VPLRELSKHLYNLNKKNVHTQGGALADISNKMLSIFLFIAIAVSLAGFMLSLNKIDAFSGRATANDFGAANFTINSSVSVVFTQNIIDFGTGVVNSSGSHNCTLNSSGPGMLDGAANPISGPNCIGFNATIDPLRIQNQGTQNVTLNVSFNSTPAAYIGGTSPFMAFAVTWNETGACGNVSTSGADYFNAVMTSITAASTNMSVCNSTQFGWTSGNRTLNLDMGIRIPQNAPPGARKLVVTAFASNP
jgi:hypothetical protein